MFEYVVALLESASDLSVSVADSVVSVVVQDMGRMADEDRVDDVMEELSEMCLSESGDYYHYFSFEGFEVEWGYASMDE